MTADSITAAAHLVLALSTGVAIWRMVHLSDRRHTDHDRPEYHGLVTGVILMLGLIMVERIYYVAARLLKPLDINLWNAHPAPVMLSIMVALCVYQLCPRIMYRAGYSARSIKRAVAIEVFVIGSGALFVAIAFG